ncbi:MAG: type VI secretion system tip protein TssI/VgrG [Polyangiaceae bacterium]
MRVGFSYAKIEVAGVSYRVSELSGTEAVSSLFDYAIGFTAPLPCPSASELVGASATLILEDRIGNARSVSGVVASCAARVGEVGVAEIRLSLRPKVHARALGRSSRTFQDKTLAEILTDVLGDLAGRLDFPSAGKIAYRVQHAESDWSFVERTIADAGLVYFFDHAAGSALVVTDNPDRGAFVDGRSMPVHIGSMIGAVPEGILAMGTVASATSTSHAMKGFRWEKPSLAVGASAGGGRYESYDRVLEVPGLNDIGGARVAAARGRATSGRVGGTARTVRLYPGMSFHTEEGGEVAVHETRVSIEEDGMDGASAIVIAFSSASSGGGALPDRTHERRGAGAYAEPARAIPGLSYAIVSADAGDEVYPEAAGRVRAQHHWDRSGAFDAKGGTWLRPTQRLAPGSMMFPRAGWVVATMGHQGDGDAPIALGRIHDGEHPPSYPLPANKTRVVYKTATVPGAPDFNEIHFEDKKGAEVMHIHASKNLDILTRQYKSERIHNDASHTVDGEQIFEHKEALDTRVDLSQTVTIGADEIAETGANFSKVVSGTETITIGGSRRIHGKDLHDTSAKKTRKLKVGAALIDISLGGINRSAKNALTLVGGVVLRLANGAIRREVGPVWLETIGGLKYARAGHSIADAAGKDFVESVGGSVTLDAGTNINEDANKSAEWTVAGKLSGSADEAMIEAHDSIEIVCGKSVLKLDDKTLTMSSTEIALSGGALEVLSGIIAHN